MLRCMVRFLAFVVCTVCFFVSSAIVSLWVVSDENARICARLHAKLRSISSSSSLPSPELRKPLNSTTPAICEAVTKHPIREMWMDNILPHLYPTMYNASSPLETNSTIRGYYSNALANALTFSDWKKTIKHAPSEKGFNQITEQLEKSLNDKLAGKEIEPIRVVVYGGSVAEGSQCTKSFKFPEISEWLGNGFSHCGWPWTLQRIADHWLGPGFLQVESMGVGGAFTPTSVGMIEMGLVPTAYPAGVTPDIIIWNHGVNDQFLETADEVAQGLHAFQMAGRKMSHCKPGLPLMIYMNDAYGQCSQPYRSMNWVSNGLQEVSDWFEEMHVGTDRIFAHHLNSYKGNPNNEGSPLHDIYPGSKMNCHGGLFVHITMASSIIFNLLSATVDKCLDEERVKPLTPEQSSLQTAFHSRYPDEIIPPSLLDVPVNGSPQGFVSRRDLEHQWELDAETYRKECSDVAKSGNSTSPSCLTKLVLFNKNEDEVNEQAEKILVRNNGWKPTPPTSYDKQGWNAHKTGDSFLSRFEITPTKKYLKLIILQSYGEKWVNSTAEIKLTRVYNVDGKFQPSQTVSHFASGHNKLSNTSPAVFVKYELPEHDYSMPSALVDLQLHCKLISGKMFKIMTLSVCDE